jgi:hypothetical protein
VGVENFDRPKKCWTIGVVVCSVIDPAASGPAMAARWIEGTSI